MSIHDHEAQKSIIEDNEGSSPDDSHSIASEEKDKASWPHIFNSNGGYHLMYNTVGAAEPPRTPHPPKVNHKHQTFIHSSPGKMSTLEPISSTAVQRALFFHSSSQDASQPLSYDNPVEVDLTVLNPHRSHSQPHVTTVQVEMCPMEELDDAQERRSSHPPSLSTSPPHRSKTYSTFVRENLFSLPWLMDFLQNSLFTQELLKAVLALTYFTAVMVFVSHMLVLTHLRAPTNATWDSPARPLPDILLDVIPRQEWGFQAAEVLISLLSMCAMCLALLHQNTLVTLRRLFCIFSTVFFIRAFSTVSTSLTNSSPHLEKYCPPVQIDSAFEFSQRAFRILFGFGMRTKGGNTCGDYIYSGHTCSLIIFNLFIVTYGPKRMFFLPVKLATSLACLMGMVFIIAAHEHYTVDVVLAIVVSILVFNEYHNVAHNAELRRSDRMRILLSAPVTYFMEHNGEGKLVNKFRIPLCHSQVVCAWRRLVSPRNRTTDDQQTESVLPC